MFLKSQSGPRDQEKDLRLGLGASFCCSLVPRTGSVMTRFEPPLTTYTYRAGGGGKLLTITTMIPYPSSLSGKTQSSVLNVIGTTGLGSTGLESPVTRRWGQKKYNGRDLTGLWARLMAGLSVLLRPSLKIKSRQGLGIYPRELV